MNDTFTLRQAEAISMFYQSVELPKENYDSLLNQLKESEGSILYFYKVPEEGQEAQHCVIHAEQPGEEVRADIFQKVTENVRYISQFALAVQNQDMIPFVERSTDIQELLAGLFAASATTKYKKLFELSAIHLNKDATFTIYLM